VLDCLIHALPHSKGNCHNIVGVIALRFIVQRALEVIEGAPVIA
jgi:hypothetical protein